MAAFRFAIAASVEAAPVIVIDGCAWHVPAAIRVPFVVDVPVPTEPMTPDTVGVVKVGVPAAAGAWIVACPLADPMSIVEDAP
jgi:hypothetical protein